MFRRSTLPKVLLLLAAFVFFSANTVHFLEVSDGSLQAAAIPNYQFTFDKATDKGLKLNLKSAILVNYDNGEVLYARNADDVRPIASITKLATAMVVIDKQIPLDQTETITKEDAYQSSRSRLQVGYVMTVRDLLYSALLNSDNRAARALARATSGSYEEFAREMNWKMKELGLKSTHFMEPTGLSAENVSTAHEVAKLMHYAYDYPLIAKITSTKTYSCSALKGKGRKTFVNMSNTNALISSNYRVLSARRGISKLRTTA
jgi:D-alanyl-D-alanine endopeptidase (penicillin-binding protein 7)